MRVIALSLVAVLLGSTSALAQHSDVEFEYLGNTVYVEPGGEGFAFEGDFLEVLPNNLATEPGFGSELAEGLGIGANDVIGFNVRDNLVFWDGTQFTSPGAATITIDGPGALPDTLVTATSGVQLANLGSGINVIGQADSFGDFHVDPGFTLANGQVGAYGLVLSLVTDANGIGESNTFGILLNNGLSEIAFEEGVEAFAGQFVPEPSAALLVMSSLGLVSARRRR